MSMKCYSQCSICLTDYLNLGSGYNHETGSFYASGTLDQYWKITDGPNTYSYPQCATSRGDGIGHMIWTITGALPTSTAIGLPSLTADGNTPCNNHCNNNDPEYRFERQFCVNTNKFITSANPTGQQWANILLRYCGDLNISSVTLYEGGSVKNQITGCWSQLDCGDPGHWYSYGGYFKTGIYTIVFEVLNDWHCNWSGPVAGTPMGLEVGGYIGSSGGPIFADNKHFGKNAICAPPYQPGPEFTLSGINCIPLLSTTTYTITPFYNATGQNIYTIAGSGSPTISATGTFSVGAGTYTITSTDAKGCSFSKIIDIYNNPFPSLTPTSQCIVPGATSNITASSTGTSPFTYSLNGGAYASNNVFNLSQGFYTVTVKDALGCTGSATAKIGNVFNAYLESKFNSSVSCDPDILVASTWPNVTPMYYSFNGSTPSVTNTFTTTGAGTYTVIATDAYGCTASSSIVVYPHPFVSAIAAPCAGPPPGNITITATASGPVSPYSYQLNTGPWQSSNTFVVPISGTYTVTASNAYGCTASTTITIPPMLVNCCNPALISPVSSHYFYGWIPGGYPATSFPPLTLPSVGFGYENTNDNIVIDGILRVTAGTTLKFNGCPNIFMGPNAEIIVDNNGTLIIENCILRAACNTKWKGITATNGTQTVRLSKPTEIHDMYNGVEITGTVTNAALLQCEGVSFIDDDFGIVLRNTQSGYAGYVRSCSFKSTSAMLGPILRTKRGVSIYDCNEVEIGGLYSGTTILGNKFENLDNGIFISANVPTTSPVLNSNIRLYNNFFVRITGGKQVNDAIQTPTNNIYSSDLGCAVYAKNYSPFYPQANIIVTVDNYISTASFPPYHISHCDKGIITSNVSMNIANTRTEYAVAGFMNTFIDGRVYNIHDNFLRFGLNGIALVGYNLKYSYVTNNQIELHWALQSNLNTSGEFYTPVAITLKRILTSPITSASSYFYINGNHINIPSEAGIGIDVMSGASDRIFDNTINYICNNTSGVSFTNIPEFIGIQLTNSYLCHVKFNNIVGNNTSRNYYGSNAGIRINKSTYDDYFCNNINSTKYGFLATSNCTTTSSSVIGNHFNDHIFAMLFLHLGSEATFGPSIGSPAVLGASGFDPDNKFGSINYPLGYKLYKNSVCIGIPLPERYYTSPFTLMNSQSGGTSGCVYQVYSNGSPTTTPNCGILPHLKMAGPTTIDSIQHLIEIATGSVIYPEFEEGARWIDEQNLYNQLSLDSVLRYSHPALDSFYTSRYNTASENIEQTDREIQMMLDSLSILDTTLFNQYLQNAETENANIVSTDQEALNVQLINEVYFKIIEMGVDSISISDDSLIKAFALSCPFITGIAAYKARALYALYNPTLQYDDLVICNAVGVYKGESLLGKQNNFLDSMNYVGTNKIVSDGGIKLYPNPADENIIISYNINQGQEAVLILYDIVGRGRKTVQLSCKANTVQISVIDLESGLYSYKYLVDGKPQGTGKLTIKNN